MTHIVDDKTRARFDAYWTPEPNTGCHLWFAARDPRGYGRFRLNGNGRKGRTVFAHRLAWEWANDRSADGFVIRHRCDNPTCVNPAHLNIGSHADNVRDRMERGRSVYVRGDKNGKAKLTEESVREMKRLFGTLSNLEIAKRYGVSPITVCGIKKGRWWRHVA